ncbi:MAG: hypothetical protein ABIO70_33015 [Pseudomonadota bacterium]
MSQLIAFVRDPRVRAGERVLDLGVIVAFAWLFTAIGLSVVFGPLLGLRGWCWLLAHHALCLAGASHELIRGWKRRHLPLQGQTR